MIDVKSNDESIFKEDETEKFISERRSNVKSELIEITDVKLENILLKHLNKLSIRKSWIAPLSILFTILLAKLTTTFKTALGINASVWEALFLFIIIFSSVWLIVIFIQICRCWNESSISNLIETIKGTKVKNKWIYTDLNNL